MRLKYQDVKVALNDRILHALHRDLQQIGVGCIGEVYVDFSVLRSVETPEPVGEVLRRRVIVIVTPGVVREEFLDRLVRELLLEKINLVQEQDD